MVKKIGTFIYNGITFIYDGTTRNKRSSPLRVCPDCGHKDRVNAHTVGNIKKGTSKGRCRPCANKAIGKAHKGKIKLSPAEVLKDGSIIHWDTRTQSKKVDVTCGNCKITRTCDFQVRYSKSGMCISCVNKIRILDKHPGWKGGKYKDKDGYIVVYIKIFTEAEKTLLAPMVRQSGYLLEHRAVMALSMERALGKNEVVHHRNGIKNDNRPENLMLTSLQDHSYHEIMTLKEEINRLRDELKNK